jgi:hypothetical protein
VTLTEKCGEQLLVQLQQIHSNAIVFQQLHNPEKRKKQTKKLPSFCVMSPQDSLQRMNQV